MRTPNCVMAIGVMAAAVTIAIVGSSPPAPPVAADPVTTTSDVRLKENVRRIDGALGLVRRLRGVRFDWKQATPGPRPTTVGREIGFIAQEVGAVLPEVVRTGPAPDGFQSVAYDRVVPVLVEAIRTLESEAIAREARITAQQKQLAALEARVRALGGTDPPLHEVTAGEGDGP